MEVKPSVCEAPVTTITSIATSTTINVPLVTVPAKGSVVAGTAYISTTNTVNCVFTFQLRVGTPPGTAYSGT